ncbi:hypothetical protein Moror_3853 [Moniliophthora roreri MCA 2997]|uniref:Uncharacterized protein n=2 Tax=Moniliophthora roreri TaxID=221103 RepID=V2XS88_MONRO|nr:hypothetical protein Moror_3853 [Moniliophthora roreri MCA 2997]KAI3611380.1 hypothetical protein WG66_002151 [Moniliophthora roreri]
MEGLQTFLSICIAEIFITLRVYALLGMHKGILAVSGTIMICQWAIGIYVLSVGGLSQPAALLSRRAELPTLPNAGPYHICQLISGIIAAPWTEAYLCLTLVFDGLAFIAILVVTLKMIPKRGTHVLYILKVIQRDGILYFFVLFSSNLVWVLLLLRARRALKLVHGQQTLVLSGVMINRITLNLKKASDNSHCYVVEDPYAWSMRTFEQTTMPWSVRTFEQTTMRSPKKRTNMRPVPAPAQRETSNGGYDLEMQSLGREYDVNIST